MSTTRKPRCRRWEDPELRRLRTLHSRGYSLTEVSRRLGRTPSSVSDKSRELGLLWDRSQTQAATAAKQADNRARRAELADWLTERALVNARRLDSEEFQTSTRTPGGIITNTLGYVPPDDELTLMKAISSAVMSVERLAKIDGGTSSDEDKSVLALLRSRLTEIRENRSPST